MRFFSCVFCQFLELVKRPFRVVVLIYFLEIGLAKVDRGAQHVRVELVQLVCQVVRAVRWVNQAIVIDAGDLQGQPFGLFLHAELPHVSGCLLHLGLLHFKLLLYLFCEVEHADTVLGS